VLENQGIQAPMDPSSPALLASRALPEVAGGAVVVVVVAGGAVVVVVVAGGAVVVVVVTGGAVVAPL
jgi:hypothetical protein